MRWPLNKQVIVFYREGTYSRLFRNFVPIFEIRKVCTRKNCTETNEHLTFDGQFFYRKKETA